MNFLVLGSELPDYNHPLLKGFNESLDEVTGLSEQSWMLRAIQLRYTDVVCADMEKLRLFYQLKVGRLKHLFDEVLEDYGDFQLPAGGLSAWIKFNRPMEVPQEVLDMVIKYGSFDPHRNHYLDPLKPIVGISFGFGVGDVESWAIVFRILLSHFERVRVSRI